MKFKPAFCSAVTRCISLIGIASMLLAGCGGGGGDGGGGGGGTIVPAPTPVTSATKLSINTSPPASTSSQYEYLATITGSNGINTSYWGAKSASGNITALTQTLTWQGSDTINSVRTIYDPQNMPVYIKDEGTGYVIRIAWEATKATFSYYDGSGVLFDTKVVTQNSSNQFVVTSSSGTKVFKTSSDDQAKTSAKTVYAATSTEMSRFFDGLIAGDANQARTAGTNILRNLADNTAKAGAATLAVGLTTGVPQTTIAGAGLLVAGLAGKAILSDTVQQTAASDVTVSSSPSTAVSVDRDLMTTVSPSFQSGYTPPSKCVAPAVLQYGFCSTPTATAPNYMNPIVNSVTPLVATLNKDTTFSVKGSNLRYGQLGFNLENCYGITESKVSGSDNERLFACIPTKPGKLNGTVTHYAYTGAVLKTFVVQVDDTTVLPAPANLKATKTSGTTWSLTWDLVKGATEYYVYQKTGTAPSVSAGQYQFSSLGYTDFISGNSNTFDAGIADTTGTYTYYWVVTAAIYDDAKAIVNQGSPTAPVSLTFNKVTATSTVTWTITDKCNDGKSISYKFFDRTKNVEWPASGTAYSTASYNTAYTSKLSCDAGDKICFGGTTGSVYWGVGVDGANGCTDCCYTCDGGTHPYSPTCSDTTGSGGGGGGTTCPPSGCGTPGTIIMKSPLTNESAPLACRYNGATKRHATVAMQSVGAPNGLTFQQLCTNATNAATNNKSACYCGVETINGDSDNRCYVYYDSTASCENYW